MSSRRLSLAVFATLAIGGPAAAAASAPPVKTPDDAVAAIRRILVRNTKPCKLDWAKIHALGKPGDWAVTVTVRSSKAGKGTAHWKIADGYPSAADTLARALAHGCA
ncbi:MAG: hypothetical protein JWM71_1955 [Solirubrobacteraceae bacterium]|nr:hypothetical protein [Solirubrobacteraceae bacterium]